MNSEKQDESFKTLKEIANFFGVPVALEYFGEVWGFDREPYLAEFCEDDPCLYWEGYDNKVFTYAGPIDYNGCWEDSLTLPDGWKTK